MKNEETKFPGKYHYHYDREEREAGLSDYTRRNLHTKGFFRRNKSLVITLIDTAVLLLLFLIIIFFIRSRPTSADTEGLVLATDANLVDGSLFVTLTFRRDEETGPRGAVRVLLRALPDDVRLELSATLPEAVGESRTIRGVLAISGKEPVLFATIDFEKESKVVQIEIGAPEQGTEP